MLQVEGQLEFGEYLRANYWYMLRKFKWFFALLLFSGVVYPAMYFAGIFGRRPVHPVESSWGFLLPFGLVTFMLVATYLGARRHFSSNKMLAQRVQYVFTTDDIKTAGPLSSGRISWETLTHVYETGHAFLLFVSNLQMIVLPKRYFETPDLLTRFRQLVNECVGKRARLRSSA